MKSLCESNKNHSISPVFGHRIRGDRAGWAKKKKKKKNQALSSHLYADGKMAKVL